jgi:SAM-dependent methyltransferase
MKANQFARTFGARATRSAGYRLTRLSSRLDVPHSEAAKDDQLTLAGDRDVEWAWALGHLRAKPGDVLDFGAGHGLLSLGAAFRGHRVVAVDLEKQSFTFTHDHIDYRQGDLNELDIGEAAFDQILNCSTVEHVGLAGRYGSVDDPDGDLRAMQKMARALRSDGTMILSVPVGRDAVFAPYHRVYGEKRLPELVAPFEIAHQEFRAKWMSRKWEPVERAQALATLGSAAYYAIGMFVLRSR